VLAIHLTGGLHREVKSSLLRETSSSQEMLPPTQVVRTLPWPTIRGDVHHQDASPSMDGAVTDTGRLGLAVEDTPKLT